MQTVSHFRRHSRAIKNFPPSDSDSEIAWSPISGFLPRTHLTLSNILLQTCLRQSSLRLTQDEVSVPPGIFPQCCPLYEDLQSPALRSPIEIIIQLAAFYSAAFYMWPSFWISGCYSNVIYAFSFPYKSINTLLWKNKISADQI